MSIAEWAQLLSTAFAAVAAGAAWAVVVQDRRRQRTAADPRLSAAFESISGEGIVPRQRIEFMNAGPGLAIGVIWFSVESGTAYGGPVVSHLGPGEKATLEVSHGRRLFEGDRADFVYLARSTDGRLHAWSHHGDYLAVRPKPGQWPSAQDAFRRFYPDVHVPE